MTKIPFQGQYLKEERQNDNRTKNKGMLRKAWSEGVLIEETQSHYLPAFLDIVSSLISYS